VISYKPERKMEEGRRRGVEGEEEGKRE